MAESSSLTITWALDPVGRRRGQRGLAEGILGALTTPAATREHA
jgi:hypothetical protein